MSTCEKCWTEARCWAETKLILPYGISFVSEYNRLIAIHRCTPEEQAGEHAEVCPQCGRLTLHQWARECMAGCKDGSG